MTTLADHPTDPRPTTMSREECRRMLTRRGWMKKTIDLLLRTDRIGGKKVKFCGPIQVGEVAGERALLVTLRD